MNPQDPRQPRRAVPRSALPAQPEPAAPYPQPVPVPRARFPAPPPQYAPPPAEDYPPAAADAAYPEAETDQGQYAYPADGGQESAAEPYAEPYAEPAYEAPDEAAQAYNPQGGAAPGQEYEYDLRSEQLLSREELEELAVGEQTLVDVHRGSARTPQTSTIQQEFRPERYAPPPPAGVIEPTLWIVTEGSVSSLTLNPEQLTLAIGSSGEECDVPLNDATISKKQLVIVRIGEEWLFVDCGVKDMVRFDGIPTRQMLSPYHCRMVVSVGKTWLVFTAYDQQNYPNPDQLPPKRTRLNDNSARRELTPARVIVHDDRMTVDSSREPILIGSHMECDFMLQGRNVKPFHAIIYWKADGLYIEPMGGHRIQINSENTADPYKLKNDDRIRLGDSQLNVEIQGDYMHRCRDMFPEEDFIFDNFSLTALGGETIQSYVIPGYGGAITIGRASTCDIPVNDFSMSRVHAQIIPSGKSFHLIDNYSSNGSYVNNERVVKSRVHAGDVVEMGSSFFIVHYC